MTGMVPGLVLVAVVAITIVGLALWRSARAGTGIWWPLVVAALVLGGLSLAAIRLGIG